MFCGCGTSPSIPTGKGTSHLMLNSFFAVGNHGSALRRFSPTTPAISPACATTSSSVPYCDSHFTAVFGPTFSTPGTLSTESPISVR